MGGTQDNGSQIYNNSPTWTLGVSGDGGDSGFDAVNPTTIFHSYTGAQLEVNFNSGDPKTWDWISDPMFFSPEQSAFYAPIRQDPVTGGQIFAGMEHIWRTQDSGGNQAFLDAHCNSTGLFGTSDQLFTGNCGDFVPIGPNLANDPSLGDKAGGWVAAIERAPSDTGTLWAGTRIGRIFISQNANAAPSAVSFTRIDTDAQPTRFPSGIAIDPTNPNHAFVTYSGYNAYATEAGTATGHIFDVTYNPTTKTATWTNIDNNIGDQPITAVVFDKATGDLYVATDFGVDRLAAGTNTWTQTTNLPPVAVYGLTINTVPNSGGERVIYAATHGRGAYQLILPAP
jgi:hypothetical protein